MGQELMKSWFKQPSTNVHIIRARHELISVFVEPTSTDMVKGLRKLLRSLKNIPRVLGDISVGRAKIEDWSALLTFFNSFKLIQETFQESFRSRSVVINESVQQVFTDSEIDINVQNIENIIDFNQSKLSDRIVVCRNVDIELDKLKDSYGQIEDILSDAAAKISKALPQVSHPINVMYFPQLGYLIVFEREHQDKSTPMVEKGEWEIIFSTDSHIYFKCEEMREMDNQFGDIYGVICDYEIEIVQSLQEEILKSSSKLLAASHLCAQIDCHLAFAEVAKMRNYVRPEMITERSLEIVEGLHPIYEHVIDTFIANDTSFQKNQCSITLLTGANYSGKTVYLTQTALIVYMAHIGSFVPARSAKIGITDRILARLSNRESVSRV
jgi:DNA mismatch repair protein MSH5